MMQTIAYVMMSFSLLLLSSLSLWYFYRVYEHKKRVHDIFDMTDDEILTKEGSKKRERFKQKLLQAGLTKQNFYEIVLASIVTGGVLITLIFLVEFSMLVQVTIVFIGVSIALFMPFVYLEEQIKARIKRIESDLAIFIDLLIIILEGGGGLNNAIDKVTTEGAAVLGKDLLHESKLFKYEFVTYGSEVAYTNLASRTGSEAVGTIVGFMRLSEETGIGVKTIFENQAQEIKSAEILSVEKKAATMNINITFVMFIFIIPAVIAMIAFPMAADALMPAFK
jgi:tight adherence protein C